MSVPSFTTASVNGYLAHKQYLRPRSRLTDVVQVTRDIVALHATIATGPYLSLWARVPGFQRGMLPDALYERRSLARVLCMRTTLHVIPSDEAPLFLQAYGNQMDHRTPAEYRGELLLSRAGLCQEEEAGSLLAELQSQVLEALAKSGPSTVREISQAVPELEAEIRHSVGKPYEGEFSIGSRLIPGMCAQGLLIRARPRGSWRSNLYEYAALSEWLPDVDLDPVAPEEAQAWLVRRYLSAFGPATFEDIRWWTGFSKGMTEHALLPLKCELVEVVIEGLGETYLMMAEDAQRLDGNAPADTPYISFLPALDPYIMGYADRRRFLAPEHNAQVFDRAGNAMPTVWVNGQVVGAWGQRKNGEVVYGLFEEGNEEKQTLLKAEAQRLEEFLGGEYLPLRTHTAFARSLK
jgi:hypothetical protein